MLFIFCSFFVLKSYPKFCIVPSADGLQERFFQYTAIDEYSRFRFIMAFKEQSTYSSVQLLTRIIRNLTFIFLKIQKISIKNNVIYTKIHPTEYIQSGEFFAVYFLCNLSKVCCALVFQRNYPLIKRKFVFPHI